MQTVESLAIANLNAAAEGMDCGPDGKLYIALSGLFAAAGSSALTATGAEVDQNEEHLQDPVTGEKLPSISQTACFRSRHRRPARLTAHGP